MKTMGQLFSFLVLLAAGGLLTLFKGVVVLSLAGLFGVGFITQLSLMQVFGILWIISLIKYKASKTKTEDFGEALARGFGEFLSLAIMYLIVWGLGFFFHWLFF